MPTDLPQTTPAPGALRRAAQRLRMVGNIMADVQSPIALREENASVVLWLETLAEGEEEVRRGK